LPALHRRLRRSRRSGRLRALCGCSEKSADQNRQNKRGTGEGRSQHDESRNSFRLYPHIRDPMWYHRSSPATNPEEIYICFSFVYLRDLCG
jgi:hypothetical protein